MAGQPAGFEAAKRAGDEAVRASNFEAAESHYSAALAEPGGAARAAVHCNRSHARLQLRKWLLAAEDATATLELQPEEKLRVKALFRRGLAREALGDLAGANSDLNLALKSAPTNEGIVTAAKRVRAALPPKPEAPVWVSDEPYTTALVMRLATAVPGSVRGYLGTNENPCVRFPCAFGLQAYERIGGLFAIRQALGPPQKAPADVNVITNDRDYQDSPNFDPEDGVSVEYDKGGNLKTVYQQLNEDLNGPWISFDANGSINLRETCCYKNGRVVSKLKSDIPEGFLAYVLRELVVPVKKALGIGLALGEEELCERHRVDANALEPAALSAPSSVQMQPRLEPYESPKGASPQGYGYGATWEELLNAPPRWEVGPAWVGPVPAEPPAGGAAPLTPPFVHQAPRQADAAPPQPLRFLRGTWIDEANDTPVGKIEGAVVVWHRSFHCRPTKLQPAEDGSILMELEQVKHRATVEHGPRTRLRWSDGDVWIRVSGGQGQAGPAGGEAPAP